MGHNLSTPPCICRHLFLKIAFPSSPAVMMGLNACEFCSEGRGEGGTFVWARLGMGTFSNDGSFMEQFLAMQKQGEAGAEGKILENNIQKFDKCDDAPSKQEEEGVRVERGNQGGNGSSASLSETGSTEAAQPSAPTEQPKAAAADSQKKKSLLAAFSTKKTIKKDVRAFIHSSAPCRPFARIHMHFHVPHKSFSQAGNAGGKETKKLAYLVSFTSISYLLGKATKIRVSPLPQAMLSSRKL